MGVKLYPQVQYTLAEDLTPDVSAGVDLEAICNEIQEACEGWGTDEGRLLKAMGSQTPQTRCFLSKKYEEMFGRALQDRMKSECGNRDFGTALQFLSLSPVEAECLMIETACSGAGTDEKVLATILMGRTNEELQLLKKTYFKWFSKDLGQIAAGELGGKLEALVMNVLQADEEEFDENYHNDEKMAEDAKALYELGQGTRGTDEVGLFKILCKSPPEYLKKLNIYYAQEYGYTLPKVLEKELGGDLDFAACFMMDMKLKPIEAIAELIDEACRGFGTRELLLTTVLIRYQMVFKEVEIAHIEQYGKTILDRVNEEAKGDYKAILQEVVATSMAL